MKLDLLSLEVENFALARALVGHDKATTAIVNFGAQTTNVTITDLGVIRLSHNIDRGSSEITRMLSRSLNVEPERADDFKKNIGLSDRPEEKEIAEVIAPVVDSLFREILRVVNGYNRLAPRKVERVMLAGGGANLFGLVDYAAKVVGLETIRANPFARIVYPAFMQPVLREIGPDFSVAVGLALRQITTR
ncbi:MAG: pilus assembly protein PilM [Candidatus Sungbacteria bacterium]|nr:pilus assembly protein PilM [Candidatus Sungbacteria bacterium]